MAWTVTDGVYTVSFAELQSLLNTLPENSVDNPHRINITNLTNENLDSSQTPNTLGWLLNFTSRKYFDLRETILPSNITRLFKTFYNCRCLIYGFNNYENITDMEMTFYGCNNLREFIGYINPTKLDNCFSGCTSLTKFINLKNKIDTVDITSSFVGCSSLEEINLNIGVATEISSLFSNCTSLKKATLIIDDVIDSYNRYIFNNCSSLEDVTIQLRRDTSFKDIERLFYNCSNLKTINISPNVINAAEETRDVFYGCSSLQEIKLIPPEEIKETNDYKVFLVSFFSNPDFSVKVYDKNGIKHNIAYITWRGLHPIQLSVQGKTDELGFFSEYDLTDESIQYSLTSNSKITKDITKPNLFGKNMIFKADSPKNFLTNIIFPDGITTDCTSSASSENKEIVLASWTDLGLPNRCNIDVTFTNGNSYGETTIANPTHPKLIVKNATGDTIGTFDICDSRGHFAGKGCWNAGDLICFKRSGNKMLMTNHDVREATSDYKIYSDNYLLQLPTKTSDLQNDSGFVDSNAYVKGVKDYNNNNPIEIGYSGASLASNEVVYLAGYKYATSLGEPYKIKDVSFDVVKDKLGINNLSKLAFVDTRSENKEPQQYNAGIYFEFKYSNSINSPFGYTYCSLITIRPWGSDRDFSGGPAVQYAIAANEVKVRYSTEYDMWSSWGRLNPASAMTSPSPNPVLSEDN